jgi:hypothetical protein
MMEICMLRICTSEAAGVIPAQIHITGQELPLTLVAVAVCIAAACAVVATEIGTGGAVGIMPTVITRTMLSPEMTEICMLQISGLMPGVGLIQAQARLIGQELP